MSNKNQMAFPVGFHDPVAGTYYEPGMSLRDWLAGQAVLRTVPNHAIGPEADQIAKYAYEIADAMMKERERE